MLKRFSFFKYPLVILFSLAAVCLAALYLSPYFYPSVNSAGEGVVKNSLADKNFDVRLAYVKAWIFRLYCVRFGL
jgi:hypothetical protein